MFQELWALLQYCMFLLQELPLIIFEPFIGYLVFWFCVFYILVHFQGKLIILSYQVQPHKWDRDLDYDL
jgi:hypothetical protein